MHLYLLVRRQKLTIFVSALDEMKVEDLKWTIGRIIKKKPQHMQLFYNDLILDDNMELVDCGLNNNNATILSPATLGLALMTPNKQFEELQITPISTPTKLSPESLLIVPQN